MTTTSAHRSSANASGPPENYAQCNFQGRPAFEIWTVRDLRKLWEYLHNDNEPFDWVMGFRDKGTGAKQYKRSRKVPVGRGISWSLATVEGRKTPETSLAFVPFSTNADQRSRWGGFDFDAHDGDAERARRLAFGAFRFLLNTGLFVILESSGSGGWHVWAISTNFRPAADWIRLLKAIARDIGAPVASGLCEIFPPDSLSRGFGKGLRAPGAWNPGTNTLSEIYWQNADSLIAELPPCVSGKSRRIGEVRAPYSGTSSIEKKVSLSLLPLSALGRLIGREDSYRINKTATRREKLKQMVGAAFHQVSRVVAEHMARAQFAEKTVATDADDAGHLKDFADLWEGMDKVWLESLTAAEHAVFSQLSTEAERGAFRIIRSYARKAEQDSAEDFPIARDNLGERIGISGNGAGLLRRKFTHVGIIAQTVPYRPNVTAARFRWLL